MAEKCRLQPAIGGEFVFRSNTFLAVTVQKILVFTVTARNDVVLTSHRALSCLEHCCDSMHFSSSLYGRWTAALCLLLEFARNLRNRSDILAIWNDRPPVSKMNADLKRLGFLLTKLSMLSYSINPSVDVIASPTRSGVGGWKVGTYGRSNVVGLCNSR